MLHLLAVIKYQEALNSQLLVGFGAHFLHVWISSGLSKHRSPIPYVMKIAALRGEGCDPEVPPRAEHPAAVVSTADQLWVCVHCCLPQAASLMTTKRYTHLRVYQCHQELF